MTIKFKKEEEGAVLPSMAHAGDAGADLTCIRITTDEYANLVYHFGLSVEIPEGYVGLLFPRSSICKKAQALTNSVGVIDSGYRGPIMVKFKPTDSYLNGEPEDDYKEGDRVAQLVIVPYVSYQSEWADELSATSRGVGGYGSTGS